MSRPLALIDGELALPRLLPLEGLPPPFGTRRRNVSNSRHAPRPVLLNAAQQAIRDAVQRRTPAVRQPSSKVQFLRKLPSPPNLTDRFADELAEAKRYLQTDIRKPQSSRSDHVLGATIFVACSIALAWLLATCSTHTSDRPAIIASARPVAPSRTTPAAVHSRNASDQPTESAKASRAAKPETPARYSARTKRSLVVPRINNRVHPAARIYANDVAPARPRIGKAEAVGRSSAPAPQSQRIAEIEWSVRPSKSGSVEQTAQMAWTAQQRMDNPTLATPTTRARIATPVGGNPDWNGHMTQRRVTDDPDAFQPGHD